MSFDHARSLGGKQGKREVVDVMEYKAPDKRLDQLLNVRKQRLGRLERERNETRNAWREQRKIFRSRKQHWRDMSLQTKQQWQQARHEFLAMEMTNVQFRKAKAVYERMKKEASQLYVECQEELIRCRQAGEIFFDANRNALEANRQQEKLSILRDEIRTAEQVSEN